MPVCVRAADGRWYVHIILDGTYHYYTHSLTQLQNKHAQNTHHPCPGDTLDGMGVYLRTAANSYQKGMPKRAYHLLLLYSTVQPAAHPAGVLDRHTNKHASNGTHLTIHLLVVFHPLTHSSINFIIIDVIITIIFPSSRIHRTWH